MISTIKCNNYFTIYYILYSHFSVPPEDPQILVYQRIDSYRVSLRGPEDDQFGPPQLQQGEEDDDLNSPFGEDIGKIKAAKYWNRSSCKLYTYMYMYCIVLHNIAQYTK